MPGTQVQFSGYATDAEQGLLDPTDLVWTFTIQHCDAPDSCHQHPVATLLDTASGDFEMPDHPAPSYLDTELRATDELGASRSLVRRLTIDSDWSGAPGRRVAAARVSMPAVRCGDAPVQAGRTSSAGWRPVGRAPPCDDDEPCRHEQDRRCGGDPPDHRR